MVLTFLRPNIRIVVYAVCLFCVVLGLKWATFDRFGSAMPDWDQWDAEAYYAIIPWFEHDHFLKNIFTTAFTNPSPMESVWAINTPYTPVLFLVDLMLST